MIALDRSDGLLRLAQAHGGDVLRADLGYTGWRRGVFVSLAIGEVGGS